MKESKEIDLILSVVSEIRKCQALHPQKRITFLSSKGLCKLMEKGFTEEGDVTKINESLKNDAKALYLF